MTSDKQTSLRFLPWLTAVIILLLVTSLLMRLDNPVSLDDGLRHFAMGRLIAAHGIGAADWGNFFYEGYFAHHAVDPWFLSDIVFAPLAGFPPVQALAVFTLVSLGALMLSFLYAFRVFRTKPETVTMLLILLVFFESLFFYRLLVARPYALVTPLVVIVIAAALQRRHWLIAAALAASVLLSHLFVFPLFVAGACVIWRFTLGERRTAAAVAAWSAGGVAAGFLLHPHPLPYLLYIGDVFLRIPFLPGMELGSEMHPGVLLGFRTLVMIAVAILLAVELKREGMTRHECAQSGLTLLGGLTFVFGLMFLRWVRAIDFLWPILILFIGLMLSVRPGLFARTFERLQPRGVRVRPSIVHLLLCLLCLVVFAGVQGALVATDNQRPLASFLVALHDVPAGSRILNPDWHFFMPAVAVRSDLLYAGGMDPSFTYVDSPAAARRMAELISPAYQSTVAPPDAKAWLEGMTALYPSQYLVLFTARHQAFIAALEAQTSLHNISEEPLIALFKLGAK